MEIEYTCELCERVIETDEDYLDLGSFHGRFCTNCVEDNMKSRERTNDKSRSNPRR